MVRFIPHLTPRILAAAAITIAVLVVAAFYVAKTGDERARSAFVRWRPYLDDLMAGEDVYARHAHPNSPCMTLVLYPFTLLPRLQVAGTHLDVGALAWLLAKAAMVVLAGRWVFAAIADGGRSRAVVPLWCIGMTLLLAGRPIVGDLMHGNVNIWILILIAAGLAAMVNGWRFTAGLALGLATVCKVTPALFLPYLLWKREWRGTAGFLVALPVFAFLVPAITFGPARAIALTQSWAEQIVVPYAVHGSVTSKHSNQSIPGLVHRLTTDSPSFYDYYDEDETDYHHVAEFDPTLAKWIVRVLGVAFLGLMTWSCRPRRVGDGGSTGSRLTAEFGVIALGMLLFSERTWKHHAVTLLIPIAVIVCAIAARPLKTRARGWLAGVLAAAFALMASTSTSVWEIFGYRYGAKLAQVYGAYVWAYVLLLGGIIYLLPRRSSRSPPTPEVEFCRVRLESPLARPGPIPSPRDPATPQ